jgi:hypothetical protein
LENAGKGEGEEKEKGKAEKFNPHPTILEEWRE